ncbi:uncharacterized protein E0L32_006013 [Thyridium curvatum]|uniref:Uncharacterized protein n=1 Tax=Thyridium curvatum TaxID=1093900 RepID=A0A507AU85_9PEZI|nr:uncharacterized protein E0L32_006013 [Thyridium curvatum]TPX13542.1 hypothetical protein E0L32_006013 [Thyridium curvatum]
MSESTPPKRRFAPIPIETTFERYRKGGPAAELTPEPSPRSPSPPPRFLEEQEQPKKEKRRFAPQLIESTRRSRRLGDTGPATRPVDKTDITPYTKHIYAPRSKRRHSRIPSNGRRESCDDETAAQLFEQLARDRERLLQEQALSAFPNSRARAGGAEHFFVREGSEDESSTDSRGRTPMRGTRASRHSRRDSSEEDVGWAVKEMQEHHEHLEQARMSTLELDRMSIDSPPEEPLWTTHRRASGDVVRPIGESLMPLIPKEPLETIGEAPSAPFDPSEEPPPARPIGESLMPYIPSAPAGQAASMPYIPASKLPPETGFRNHRAPFGAPLSGFRGANRDLVADREYHKLRTRASPPMLGKDLVFRRCPSPKQTKMEPDHPFPDVAGEDTHRDVTGQKGLWQGYCYSPEKKEWLARIERPAMIATPLPQAHGAGDPFAAAFGTAPVAMSEEPSPKATGCMSAGHNLGSSSANPEHRTRHGEAKGLHMLMGLDERLRKEKAAADLEEKIAAEFTDAFVTQVYNYLSLGYPAMARFYDDELSKIARMSVDDLESSDESIMDGIGGPKGHIMMVDGDDDDSGGDSRDGASSTSSGSGGSSGDEKKCPRWRALKEYIFEWARQHPDLDSISPLAWGVRERRGSWGI